MRVLNCMWSAETAYHSVHLVLSNFLDAIAPVSHESLFLMGTIRSKNFLVMHSLLEVIKDQQKNLLRAIF